MTLIKLFTKLMKSLERQEEIPVNSSIDLEALQCRQQNCCRIVKTFRPLLKSP